ncbi:MAG: A/G-specific adenine glycosylase [Gammaproteobacteria bacterium]|nr:A/G-specific adenine glycosylase [Gammaproteobacteria bacterium]
MNYLSKNKNNIQKQILQWYELNGRKNLPWKTSNIYKIWISEIMLQQTQVKTVIPYYNRFINKYPDINALYNSSLDNILEMWSGLGYYRRAENIHKTASIVKHEYNGLFPTKFKDIIKLPGIGRTTASAILTFSRTARLPILDGNIKRLFARYFFLNTNLTIREQENLLWKISEDLLPIKNSDNFCQALMDLGSLICTKNDPKCSFCPIRNNCKSKLKQNFTIRIHKPKLKKDQKRVYSLFITNKQNCVYLERINFKNLWKGLFSSPLFTNHQQMLIWMKENKLENNLQQDKYNIEHNLSHIKFIFTVYFCQINTNKNITENREYWYNLSNIKCAIPKFQDKIINLYREKYG